MRRIFVALLPSAIAVLIAKHNTSISTGKTSADIDCADETILRLIIAESFFSETVEHCTQRWYMKPEDQGGMGMTQDEVDFMPQMELTPVERDLIDSIKRKCTKLRGHDIALGPRLLRMTFHDAVDFNNLMFANGSDAPATMGKVDSCLHTALLSVGLSQAEDDDDWEKVTDGDPNHNRGLKNAVNWVLHMASQSRLSQPDIQVLGTIVAMEAWLDGPEMRPKYGRKKGTCSKSVCSNENCWDALTPFFKTAVAEPVGGGMFCPMTNTLEPLRNLLGLTLEELVALQGAHSVGGIIVCSGLGNVAAGPYCPSKFGLPPGNFFEEGNLDGSAFDDTPGKLDNRYYQMLMDESYEGVPSCDELLSRKDEGDSFPYLSVVGGHNVVDDENKETCALGVAFEDENQCEVEACVFDCAHSTDCQDADNSENDDYEEYIAGFESCNLCKKSCSSKYRRRLGKSAQKETLAQCKEECTQSVDCVATADLDEKPDCKEALIQVEASIPCTRNQCTQEAVATFEPCRKICDDTKDSCREKAELETSNKEKRLARGDCNDAFKPCVDECRKNLDDAKDVCQENPSCQEAKEAEEAEDDCTVKRAKFENCRLCPRGCAAQALTAMHQIDNRTGLEVRPVRWCKRLKDVQTCLDPSVKVPTNGGWRGCPENKRITHPNTGQGRLNVVQNVECWTTFRGLNKRVAVLPSDWSYLGRNDTKALFQKYGADESAWKEQFVGAFTKVSEKGWAGQLHACQAVECVRSSDKIVCSVAHDTGVGNAQNPTATDNMKERRKVRGLPEFVRPTSLEFPLAQCEPRLTQSSASCQLIGGFGLKAKLQCGDDLTYCFTAAAAATRDSITEEWKSGGKEPTCQESDSSMLQKKQKTQKRAHQHFRGASVTKSRVGLAKADGMLEDDAVDFIQSSVSLAKADQMPEEDFVEDEGISFDDEESSHEEL